MKSKRGAFDVMTIGPLRFTPNTQSAERLGIDRETPAGAPTKSNAV